MAIRKVSDLEGLDFDGTDSEGNPILSDDVMNSLFEVSFPDHAGGFHSYKSMYTTYGGIKLDIMGDILSNDSGEVHFWEICHFHEHCYFYNGIEISGDFFLNKDIPNAQLTTLTYIKNKNNYIAATQNNYLSALDTNWLIAPTVKIGPSETNPVVTITNNNASFNGNVTIGSGKTLTVGGPAVFNSTATFNGIATFAQTIQGTCTKALWADLAECYEADQAYESGTLVKFGGSKEITIAGDNANAVITTKPGFLMNALEDDARTMLGVALVGRVPVKIAGQVAKFDEIALSKTPGIAMKSDSSSKVLGIALADKTTEDVDLVECVVKMTF